MKTGCDSARDIVAGAASLRPYEGTADSHEEGVEALRFTLTHRSHKTAANLIAELAALAESGDSPKIEAAANRAFGRFA